MNQKRQNDSFDGLRLSLETQHNLGEVEMLVHTLNGQWRPFFLKVKLLSMYSHLKDKDNLCSAFWVDFHLEASLCFGASVI